MKLVYFNDYKIGVIKGHSVVDITDLCLDIPHIDRRTLMNGLIAEFEKYREKIEISITSESEETPLSTVKLHPPIPLPRNIDCMAVNYMEDGTRDAPAPINGFHKSPSSIIGTGDTMILDDIDVAIPAACILVSATVNLNKADASFDKAARYQALPAKMGTFLVMHAIEILGFPGFPLHVQCFRGYLLHAVGQFKTFDASLEFEVQVGCYPRGLLGQAFK